MTTGAGDLSTMVGSGFYNRNSSLQAAGIELLLSIWKDACGDLSLGSDSHHFIADYGCSQGANSIAPIGLASAAIRRRSDRPIYVLHTDLPGNDFSSLFRLLEESEASYLRSTSNVFAMAIGKSYFDQLVPDASLDLIWNTWTLQWMSRKPIDAPDHVIARFSNHPEVVERARQQHAADWRRFLELRDRELRPGGRMLTAFVASTPEKGTGWEELCGELWEAIADLGREGILSEEELTQITIPVGGRMLDEIIAPFGHDRRFHDLELKWIDVLKIEDPLWGDFEASGDAAQLAERRTNAVRAWAEPAIFNLIDEGRDRPDLIKRIFSNLQTRLERHPLRHSPYFTGMLIEKAA